MNFLLTALESPGFLFPVLGIGRELQARGHRVAILTGPQGASFTQAAGLQRIPRGPGSDDGRSFEVENWGTPPAIGLQLLHLQHALQHFPAQAILSGQLTLGPQLLRIVTGIPTAVLGLAFFPYWPQPTAPPQQQPWAGQWDRLHEAATFLGIPGIPPHIDSLDDLPLLGDHFFVRSVPQLEALDTPLPTPRASYVGSGLYEPDTPPDPELDAFIASALTDGAHILYACPGRSFDTASFWPILCRALGSQPSQWRVIASVGRHDRDTGTPPPNFLFRNHLPQGHILRHAHAVLASGHSTAVLGALHAGLPCLVMGGGSRSEVIGQRLAASGAGFYIPTADFASLPPETAAQLCDQALSNLLTSAPMRQRASSMSKAFQALPTASIVADALEQLAAATR